MTTIFLTSVGLEINVLSEETQKLFDSTIHKKSSLETLFNLRKLIDKAIENNENSPYNLSKK